MQGHQTLPPERTGARLLCRGGPHGLVLKQHEPRFPTEAAITRLPLLTGCLGQEIVSLHWTECREGHLHRHLCDSRTGPRMIRLLSSARRILNGLPRDPPWMFASTRTKGHISSSTVGKLWTSIRAEAGLSDVHLHDLRHTYASHAVKQSTSLPVVSRLLGLARPTMTTRCTRGRPGSARRIGRTTFPEMQSQSLGKTQQVASLRLGRVCVQLCCNSATPVDLAPYIPLTEMRYGANKLLPAPVVQAIP